MYIKGNIIILTNFLLANLAPVLAGLATVLLDRHRHGHTSTKPLWQHMYMILENVF